MKKAEVYDFVKNAWKKLPDMPEEGAGIRCVGVQNKVLISGRDFRLISYDIDNEAYSYVELPTILDDPILISSKEKLYLIDQDQSFEMNKQCEVLDTFTVDFEEEEGENDQTYSERTIFFLMTGKVICIDPYEKKAAKIQDRAKLKMKMKMNSSKIWTKMNSLVKIFTQL